MKNGRVVSIVGELQYDVEMVVRGATLSVYASSDDKVQGAL